MAISKKIYYYDVTKVGRDYTGTKDVTMLVNESAVMESVQNILNTEPGQRVMNPEFGCRLERFLFDPVDQVTAAFISKEIEDALTRFETRISNLQIDIMPSEDENSFDITIYFDIIINQSEQKLNFQLDRIR